MVSTPRRTWKSRESPPEKLGGGWALSSSIPSLQPLLIEACPQVCPRLRPKGDGGKNKGTHSCPHPLPLAPDLLPLPAQLTGKKQSCSLRGDFWRPQAVILPPLLPQAWAPLDACPCQPLLRAAPRGWVFFSPTGSRDARRVSLDIGTRGGRGRQSPAKVGRALASPYRTEGTRRLRHLCAQVPIFPG